MKKIAKLSSILSMIVVLFVSQVSAASFKDVEKHWAKETIQWASSKGIAKGYEDGTFKPNNSVTEAEFLALLIRSYEPANLNESIGRHWADPYYVFAAERNYPNRGQDILTIRNTNITRGHVADILAGTQGVNYQGRDAIQYLLGKGLAKGKDTSIVSIENFGGEDTLTRAEAVQFIKNVLEKGIKDHKGNPIIQPRPTKPSPQDQLPTLPKPPKTDTKPLPSEITFLSPSKMMDAVNAEMKKLGFSDGSYDTRSTGWKGTGENGLLYIDHRGMVSFGIDQVNDTNMKGLEIMMNQVGVSLNDDMKNTIQSLGNGETKHYQTEKMTMGIDNINGGISITVAKKK